MIANSFGMTEAYFRCFQLINHDFVKGRVVVTEEGSLCWAFYQQKDELLQRFFALVRFMNWARTEASKEQDAVQSQAKAS